MITPQQAKDYQSTVVGADPISFYEEIIDEYLQYGINFFILGVQLTYANMLVEKYKSAGWTARYNEHTHCWFFSVG